MSCCSILLVPAADLRFSLGVRGAGVKSYLGLDCDLDTTLPHSHLRRESHEGECPGQTDRGHMWGVGMCVLMVN